MYRFIQNTEEYNENSYELLNCDEVPECDQDLHVIKLLSPVDLSPFDRVSSVDLLVKIYDHDPITNESYLYLEQKLTLPENYTKSQYDEFKEWIGFISELKYATCKVMGSIHLESHETIRAVEMPDAVRWFRLKDKHAEKIFKTGM